jgi:transcriptional regulator with XRE-family HTH domain
VNLRELRKGRGLTQGQLGVLAGMDQATVSRIENGKQTVSLEQLRALAGALGNDLAELVREAA